ncbi:MULTISPECIES: sensor histidine kinase [Calothrix]|uniref:histidine kinase n=2 Tax=Calothrix TaxID=1186 RepID=A0ABR8ABG9_9CYAN|nr:MULTISPECIES: ATP-binding protein [Calothrix]MBD2197322.1 HAMP domain-containing histidine kinase [Calothrix parietina FACHB-288]MBD2228720.1 HAMP domain-containing histidine kinase [Calothrix anomala FACHB-343]
MTFQNKGSNVSPVSNRTLTLTLPGTKWFLQIFNRLSIGNKIKFGYAIALGVGIFGTTIGLILGDRYQQQAFKQEENAFKEINMLQRLQASILQTRTHQQQLIPLVANPELYKEEYSHITDKHTPDIQKVWSELHTYIKTADYQREKHTDNIPQLLQTYHGVPQAYLQELAIILKELDLSPLTAEKIATAQQKLLKFTNSELALKFDGISDSLVEVINAGYEDLKIATNQFQIAEQIRIKIIVGSILLSAALATLLALLTSRTITRPVQALTSIAQRVTQESNFDLQTPVTTTDEIGILGDAFNQVLQRVKSLLEEQKMAALRQQQLQETQLIQSEKMSSLGRMLAGVAHEINNPVNFIYGNLAPAIEHVEDLLELLRIYQEEVANTPATVADYATEIDAEFVAEDLPKLLHSMKFGADRVRQIVLSLKNFSRLEEAEAHAVNLHECIDSTLLILNNRIKKGITVERNYGDIPNIEGFAGSLYQVFMNIINNALDALEGKDNSQEAAKIAIATERQDNNWVVVRIADNGSGIPVENQAKIFETFFTTKPRGIGTGMGLSISYQIVVEKHRGQLTCKSEAGKGTEFMISLPIQLPSEVDSHNLYPSCLISEKTSI